MGNNRGRRVLVDRLALWSAADRARAGRGLTWAQVAAEIGTSASTFSRLRRGDGTDADTFTAILAWLDADAADFVAGGSTRSDRARLPIVSSYLRSAPALNSDEARVIDALLTAALQSMRSPRKGAAATTPTRPRHRKQNARP